MLDGTEPDVPSTVFSDREYPIQRGGTIRYIARLRCRPPEERPHLAKPLFLGKLGGDVSIMQDDSDPIVPDPEISFAVLKDATDVKPTSAPVESQTLVINDREGLSVVPEHRGVCCEPMPPALPRGNGRGRVSNDPTILGVLGERVRQVGEGLSVVPIHTRPRFQLGRPRCPMLLEPKVASPQFPIILGSVVPAGGGNDLLPVEAADPDTSIEPNHSVSIFMDRSDLVVAQAVLHREIGELLAVETADTFIPTPEPVVALAVLKDGAHGLEPEPCRRAGGVVVQLRSRHVRLRLAGCCTYKGKNEESCEGTAHLAAHHQLLSVNGRIGSHCLHSFNWDSLSAQRSSSGTIYGPQ